MYRRQANFRDGNLSPGHAECGAGCLALAYSNGKVMGRLRGSGYLKSVCPASYSQALA